MQFLIDHAPAWTLPYIYHLTEREWMLVFNSLIAAASLGLLIAAALIARRLVRQRAEARLPFPRHVPDVSVAPRSAPMPAPILGSETIMR